jgi:hypothetical protein
VRERVLQIERTLLVALKFDVVVDDPFKDLAAMLSGLEGVFGDVADVWNHNHMCMCMCM